MYAQQKPIENLHIVRERDRQRFRELLAVISLGVPVGLFLLLFTWQNVEVIRLAREATQLESRRTELQKENRRLALEMERRTALVNVERRARELGFHLPQSDQLVIVATEEEVWR
jgi:cell division protein FtsL